jgi:predicted Zn-dependent peptidase
MYDLINIDGLTLIFSPFTNVETASLGIFVRIGSRFEKKSLRGIAHFLEHILFKGSHHYSHRQIKQEIEGRGGTLNGFTSQEYTGYYAYFLNKNLKLTLDILLDMVFRPLLKEEDIAKERNVILEEIKMYNDLPSSRVGILLEELLFRDHPLGEPIIGQFSTVKGIEKTHLAHFRNNYYGPSNIVVSFSGDVSRDEIIVLLKKKIKCKSSKPSLKTHCPLSLKGLHIKAESKKLEQAHLGLGFRSVSYLHKNRFVADLINVLLGANMSSRLFEEVREKRALCYEISTEVRKFKDTGAFVVHAGLDKAKINLVIRCILKELKKLKEEPVPSKELQRAKDYVLGHIAMALERPPERMFYAAESYLTINKIYSLPQIKKEVERITSLDIQKLAQDIFDLENMCIACVGDFEKDIEKKMMTIVKEK